MAKLTLPLIDSMHITRMPRLLSLLFKVSLPLVVLDQVTKWWVVLNYKQPYHPVQAYPYVHPGKNGDFFLVREEMDVTPVIDGFFNIVRVHNQGVAFGFGNGSSWAPIVFLIVPFVALCVVSVLWKKGMFTGVAKWSAPLLVAGVIGNLIDRLLQGFFLKGYESASFWTRLSEGYVVDFLDFKLPFYDKIVPASGGHWPSFNVADSCICIAATLLFISAFREGKDAKNA